MVSMVKIKDNHTSDIQINTHDNEKDILPFGRPSDDGGMRA